MTTGRASGHFDLRRNPNPPYRHSPHIAQWTLQDRMSRFVSSTVAGLADDVAASRLPARILELGASHGGYTNLLLASDCDVVVAEMASHVVDRTSTTIGHNQRLTIVHDPDASLTAVQGPFSLIVVVSVLHHVPDYVALLDRLVERLAPGGMLITMQDPLWYPRVGRATRSVDRGAYLAWRISRGEIRQGVGALVRRLRGIDPVPTDRDEVPYHHVVRQGVDERLVAKTLADRFASVEVSAYWSHHLAALHPFAERAGLANTFAIRAIGRCPDRSDVSPLA